MLGIILKVVEKIEFCGQLVKKGTEKHQKEELGQNMLGRGATKWRSKAASLTQLCHFYF
ncbi:hypothetical protein TorRG33x02_330150 [Trema orientale]|uniref:Uncharacterized protein n=1 Tax=Trema orientale TaxID=63057 RepID=A0A2P5B7K3_TREOI|nr:hypothetical protein TorRG33x02_330150 [Trema orientale]